MKRILSLAVATALGVLGSLVAAIPAAAAPVTTADWSYYRVGHDDGTTVDVFEGEDTAIQFSAIIGPDWSGWGHPKKKKYTFTTSDFSVTDGSLDFPYSIFYAWEGTSSTDENCYDESWFTTKFILPQRTCVDTVAYTAVVLLGVATDDMPIWTDADEAEYRGNGRLITTDDGLSFDAYSFVESKDTSSISVDTDKVTDITVQAEMCVDESQIENGDSATRALSVQFDGTNIAETTSTVVPWVDWQWTPESTPVVLEGEEPLQNLTDGAAGWVTTPDVGPVTVTVSADLRIGGSSILEPCSQDYAGPLDTGSGSGTPSASDIAMDLPSAFSWVDGGTPDMVSDGFGGVFALEHIDNPDTGNETNSLTHLGSSGDNDNFAGDGVATIDLPGSGGVGDVGRFGAGGSNWYAASWWDSEALAVVAGSMTTTGTDSVVIDTDTLALHCGRAGAVVDSVSMISAPMDNPLVRIDCHFRASKKRPHVPVTALALVDMSADNTLSGAGGFPSSSMTGAELAFMDISVNPAATDRDGALLVYSQSSKVKRLGTEYALWSIEPSGIVNKISLPTNPFPTHGVESLNLVPGATEGMWVGFVAQPYWTRKTYHPNEHVVKVWNGEAFFVGAEVDSGYTGVADEWQNTLVSLGSNDAFGQISFARSSFDNEAIGEVTLVTWNAETGSRTEGESITTVDPTHGYEPLLWSSPGTGDPNFFWITSETGYQVVSWDIP